MNFFEVLGLDGKFTIDQKQLENNYFLVQKKFHPDKAIDAVEKLHFLEISDLANKAYKTLKDPLLRAIYMLELEDLRFESNSSIQKEILIEAMEDSEYLEDLNDYESIEKFFNEKNLIYKEIVSHIDSAFRENAINKVKDLTLKLQYVNKLLENIKIKKQNAIT